MFCLNDLEFNLPNSMARGDCNSWCDSLKLNLIDGQKLSYNNLQVPTAEVLWKKRKSLMKLLVAPKKKEKKNSIEATTDEVIPREPTTLPSLFAKVVR